MTFTQNFNTWNVHHNDASLGDLGVRWILSSIKLTFLLFMPQFQYKFGTSWACMSPHNLLTTVGAWQEVVLGNFMYIGHHFINKIEA